MIPVINDGTTVYILWSSLNHIPLVGRIQLNHFVALVETREIGDAIVIPSFFGLENTNDKLLYISSAPNQKHFQIKGNIVFQSLDRKVEAPQSLISSATYAK